MRILIATGGSEHSDEAVRLGAVLISATGSPATVLTVIKHEWERLQADLILERSLALLGSGFRGRVVNLDISLGMLRQAERRVHATAPAALPRVEFRRGGHNECRHGQPGEGPGRIPAAIRQIGQLAEHFVFYPHVRSARIRGPAPAASVDRENPHDDG